MAGQFVFTTFTGFSHHVFSFFGAANFHSGEAGLPSKTHRGPLRLPMKAKALPQACSEKKGMDEPEPVPKRRPDMETMDGQRMPLMPVKTLPKRRRLTEQP